MVKENSANPAPAAYKITRDREQRTGAVTLGAALHSRYVAGDNCLISETVSVARLLTQEAAAEILSVSPKWLERDRWVERRIPFVKVGRLVRYRAADVSAYIEANVRSVA